MIYKALDFGLAYKCSILTIIEIPDVALVQTYSETFLSRDPREYDDCSLLFPPPKMIPISKTDFYYPLTEHNFLPARISLLLFTNSPH